MSSRLVLAIDTTVEFGSLALADDATIIEEVAISAADGYGHILFAAIEELLARHHVPLSGIGLFAAAKGPGTFTGVRVGLTAAKGFAAALGKPAAGVSNLQALALLGAGAKRAAVLDARRGDVYAALFDDQARAISAESVAPLHKWVETLPDTASFVFTDSKLFAPILDESRFRNAPRIVAGRLLAGAIARLAWDQASDPALLDANYVRKSDAEMFWADR